MREAHTTRFKIIFSGVLLILAFFGISFYAWGANIDATEHWAWNEVVGWVDFLYSGNVNVTVSPTEISGFANSSIGEISLDCTTPGLCGAAGNYKVSNDGAGNLAGWGWNDSVGWISFCGNDSQNSSWTGSAWVCPPSPTYQVYIDGSDSNRFKEFAWNDLVGWISFNCLSHSGCGSSDYKVKTSWASGPATGTLQSVVFDTGSNSGAQLNSLLWRGALNGGEVRFQIAMSNASSGPWIYDWSTTASTSNAILNEEPTPLSQILFSNKRYYRYKIILYSDSTQTQSPQVDDVVINWSQ